MSSDDILNFQNILFENKKKGNNKIEKLSENNNSFYLNKKANDSIEDLGNLIQKKSSGKLLLFNKKKELLVIQRNSDDPEYPMHYSLIDFIIDKQHNNISTLLEKASFKKKIKISYGHHNSPQNLVDEKLYILEFNTDIIYSDKRMNKVFWANEDKLNEIRNSMDYILTPLFQRLLLNYNPFYDSIHQIDKYLNFGDLEYYDTSDENKFMLFKPYSYIKSLGGKKLRNMIIDMCTNWIPLTNNTIIIIKEIIDTIHSCTLAIDDIEDGSELRRKCKCAHLIYGEPLTINASYMKIFSLLNNIDNSKVIKHVMSSLYDLHEGQGADIYWTTNKYCPTINQYLKMVEKKTGSLLFLIYKLFFELNSEKEEIFKEKKESIILFFRTFSKFYQIRDDYINLTSFNYWQEKGLCSDIDEGKFTYPIILAMSDINCYDELYEIITSNERYDQKNKLRALDLIQTSGALSRTRSELDEIKEELILIGTKISNDSHQILDLLKILDY
jgi:geranylgeranyl diphosphate synthase, type III